MEVSNRELLTPRQR